MNKTITIYKRERTSRNIEDIPSHVFMKNLDILTLCVQNSIH